MTSDTPNWFQRLVYRHAMLRQLRDQILGFVGIKPTRFTHFTGASHPEPTAVENWVATVRGFGTSAC